MVYLSKGIVLGKPSGTAVSISHCGALRKLEGDQAKVWLSGQYGPNVTENAAQDAALEQLTLLGVAEPGDESDDRAIFRLLANCSICPVRSGTSPSMLTRAERRSLKWIRHAGLRLTMAELAYLSELGVKPTPELLGVQNRQVLTEAIYSAATIYDGILETMMEKSAVRDCVVFSVLGLLRKRKIFLI